MFDANWNKMQPFSPQERQKFCLKIQQNIFRMIGTLIVQAERMGLKHSRSEFAKYSQQIIQHIGGELDTLHQRHVELTPDLAQKISALWTQDSGISKAWDRRREFLISDATEYFLSPNKISQIAETGYIPTVDDLLRVRDPTTGIKDYNFRLHEVYFTIHDMGGQPVERARLPHYLETWLRASRPKDRNFILYVASLADYNQKHPTHRDRTVLDESIDLFKVRLLSKYCKSSRCH